MPAKSKAQYDKMQQLYHRGMITKAQYEEATRGVDRASLPDRLAAKKGK